MAHGITDTDNLFSTRKPTWHGLGSIFESYPTRAEAQAIAHPWEPVEEPLFKTHIEMTERDGEVGMLDTFKEVHSHKAITRSDNGETIGVVGKDYQPISNNELWDIAEALEQSGDDILFETGGSLAGGSKVWLMIKLKEPLEVPGDPNGATVPYYTLQNSHDGSGSFRGQATMTRIVCANTAHAADLDAKARGTEFTFRHSKNVKERIEQARQAVLAWRTGLTDLEQKYEFLLGQKIGSSQIAEFEERYFPINQGVMSERQIANMEQVRQDWSEVLFSDTNARVHDSAYGLVQATIEYAEHVRKANSHETRFKRTYLDRNRIVSDAVRIAELVAA